MEKGFSPVSKEALDRLVELEPAFHRKTLSLDGYRLHIYAYALLDYEAFARHLPLSLEVRGFTFVEPEGGRPYPIPHLHKFFNAGEVPWVPSLSPDGEYLVAEKLDGSLIAPLPLGDKVLWKTKNTLSSPQARRAGAFARKGGYERLVLDLWERELVPLFEWISPEDQVVLPYPESSLVLLAIRSQKGTYLHPEEAREWARRYGIPFVPLTRMKGREVLKAVETLEGKEGFVVMPLEGITSPVYPLKVKGAWYRSLHALMTSTLAMEHEAIRLVLSGSVDDVLPLLPEGSHVRPRLMAFASALSRHVEGEVKRLLALAETYKEAFQANPSEVVEALKGDPYFSALMKAIRGASPERVREELKRHILHATRKQSLARAFLKTHLPGLLLPSSFREEEG